MLQSEERAFERKAEKMLAGHRELPTGRHFLCFTERFRSDVGNDDFKERYDKTFPNAPDTKQSMDSKFCSKCDKRLSHCQCN